MNSITNKKDFDMIIEGLRDCLTWYKEKHVENYLFKLYLANGEIISIKIPCDTVAHLLGINTDVLALDRTFNSTSSFENLCRLVDNSYDVWKKITKGEIKAYQLFSDYILLKIDNFKQLCSLNFKRIEFICKYSKDSVYMSGYSPLEGNYYIAMNTSSTDLLIMGLVKKNNYYVPLTNRLVREDNIKDRQFLIQLLNGQSITIPQSVVMGNNTKYYLTHKEKLPILKKLNNIGKNYKATVSVVNDAVYFLEKLNEVYDRDSTDKHAIEEISKKILRREYVDVREYGDISFNLLNLIRTYNESLDSEISEKNGRTYSSIIEELEQLKKMVLTYQEQASIKDQHIAKLEEDYELLQTKYRESSSENDELRERLESIKMIVLKPKKA
jgi:hypothetical protein